MGHNQLVWRGKDERVAGEGRGTMVRVSQDGHRWPSQKVQDQTLANHQGDRWKFV